MKRRLERELLDDLPADDPRAVTSRGDLRRLNALMGHAGIMKRAVHATGLSGARSVAELGAGDGTFMLRLAWLLAGANQHVALTLVDQQRIVSAATLRKFAGLGWTAENQQADVFAWLTEPVAAPLDLMTANLFLHHFTDEQLRDLFKLIARRTNLFVACEPRRAAFPLAATRALWLIGCNSVTQHDAAISVRAGFRADELSRLWPDREQWRLTECGAGLFSHSFVAQRI